ncbi:hypothetical protein NA56DRAFT_652206 [Hyaloscypha hepaticicola]|uniref:Uncharacterized protein n=1 Tax=Hyaloscypha hepaticicola TaxID=2082293 RepID=A0A2J6PFQ1_9HELO|nr:hypothetical protein NA56DRAFT_652206 [Hyaloscypha hepaticicola]
MKIPYTSRAPFQVLLFWVVQQGNTIQAQSFQVSNTSDNSAPKYEPRWKAGPKDRGTLGLVFSCVITLFLCVWTTVHVNIEPPDAVNPTLARFIPIKALKKNDTLLKFLAKRSVRKLGWGSFTLLVPEGVMAIATYERKTAYLLRDAVNAIINKREGVEQWDLSLAYYAIMGGFVIHKADYDKAIKQFNKTGGGEKEAGSIPHGDLERPGGTETAVKPRESLNLDSKENDTIVRTNIGDAEKQMNAIDGTEDPPKNNPLTLTPYGVLQLAKWQWETHTPTNTSAPDVVGEKTNLFPITSGQVDDKSNANSLAKGLIAWQALWMIVQVIGRQAEHPRLPVTLLELHTCLHTFCAFAMYITWWDKPVDIEVPTEIRLTTSQINFLRKGASLSDDQTNPFRAPPNDKNEESPTDIASAFLTSRSGIGKLMYHRLCGHRNLRKEYFSIIGDAYIRLWKVRRAVWKEGLLISLVGLIFGGVHLVAWHASFPTYVERILWQIAAAVTATAWSGFVLSLWLSVFVEERREDSRLFSRACGVFLGVGIFPVMLVRVYLLVESFASLRRLPYGSYELNIWSNVWPHAG